MNILFICTGNTCRSPMAEALMKQKKPDASVSSAGIFAVENNQASEHTINVLKEKDIDLNHQSQPVTAKLLHWADLVLTMTTQHKQSLVIHFPDFQTKYFTLKEYASDADKEVWDQLKKEYANYEAKRSTFIRENEHKIDNSQLETELTKHVHEDIIRIRQLEGNMINYNVSDPFGGDKNVYVETREELEEYIDLLVKKLHN